MYASCILYTYRHAETHIHTLYAQPVQAAQRLAEPKRYYHIEGTEKKDPAVAVPGGSDLDKVGFDAKRGLEKTGW